MKKPVGADKDALMKNNFETIVRKLGAVRDLDVGETTSILQVITASFITTELAGPLMAAINSKLQLNHSVMPLWRYQPKVDIVFVENYLSESMWPTFLDTDAGDKALMLMSMRLRFFGCENYTEPTFGKAASLALAGNGLLSPENALSATRTLKSFYAATGTQFNNGPKHFPQDPSLFRDSDPAWYARVTLEEPFVASKLTKSKLPSLNLGQFRDLGTQIASHMRST